MVFERGKIIQSHRFQRQSSGFSVTSSCSVAQCDVLFVHTFNVLDTTAIICIHHKSQRLFGAILPDFKCIRVLK